MLDLLFATLLSCEDAQRIIETAKLNRTEMPKHMVREVVETVKDSTSGCNWDAND